MSILISVEAEDKLLCVIGNRLLEEFGKKYKIEGGAQDSKGHPDSKGGIEKNAPAWNLAAGDGNVRMVLMDMDELAFPHNKKKCPESEIRRVLKGKKKHDNFLFRIAVFESESWLLADRDGFSNFFKVSVANIPEVIDGLRNAKERSHKIIRGSRIDKRLVDFAKSDWKPKRAAKNSKSLRRTLERLDEFGG